MHLKGGNTLLHFVKRSDVAAVIIEALLEDGAKIETTDRVRNHEGDAVMRFTSCGGPDSLGVWRCHRVTWAAMGWGRCGHGYDISDEGMRGWLAPRGYG